MMERFGTEDAKASGHFSSFPISFLFSSKIIRNGFPPPRGDAFLVLHYSLSRLRTVIESVITGNGLLLKSPAQKLDSLNLTFQKHLPHFRKIVLLALFYAALAFAYSSIGFLHPEVSHFHEYSSYKFSVEIAGHFLFGFIAGIPFLDLELALLTGAGAVFIDTDHILSALNFQVSGRPDHSFLFIVVAGMILFYVVQRSRLPRDFVVKFAYFAPVAVFSHIAYDIFAVPIGSSSSFDFFVPFSFQIITMPYIYWIVFEAVAMALSFAGYLTARHIARAPSRDKLAPGREKATQRTKPDNFVRFIFCTLCILSFPKKS